MTEATLSQLLPHSTLAIGFISPWFALAGALAVAIPIIIHLLNRRRFKVLDWAAMQFLLAAMRKNRRRIQFEQWILLATRCVLIALAGLALARPLGCADSSIARLAGQSAAMHVIVLDNSYSMAYQADRPEAPTHLDHAKRLAKALVARLSSGSDSVVLITASQPAEPILGRPSYDLASVSSAIDRVEQKWSGTDLVGALTLAEQVGKEESAQPTRYLHILSDATTSAWRNGNESAIEGIGPKLAGLYRVRHYNLALPDQSNAAILDVAPASNLVRTRFSNDFRAVARAYGASVESSVLWKLGEESLPGGSSLTIDQQTPPVTQSNAQLRAGGATVVSASLGTPDRLPIDNTRHHTIDVAAEMKILIVEGRRGMGPLDGSGAFLELALAPPTANDQPGRTTSSYIKPERISDIELAGKVLGEYRAVLLTDVAQLAGPVADQLVSYVRQGGTVVWFMGEQVQRESYNAVLLPRGLVPGALTKQQKSDGFVFAFNPTGNNHPLLQAFSNIDKTGLETAQVFTYWQVAPADNLQPARVLSYATNNDPAILLHHLGDGRVVFFTSSADAEWTSFPAKPAYLSLMHEIIAGTVAGSERWMNLSVGDRIEIPVTQQLGGVPVLRDPSTNTDTPLNQATRESATIYQSAPLTKPGVYRLVTGDTSAPVSVNVPANEADIRPLGNEAIKTALGNIEMDTLADSLPTEGAAIDEANDFGWTLMTIVLVLLGVECFMAMRFGHYKR